ncbi:MAG: FtsH protease activity modulator HflK [Deltaproteobacteria bacterium]|nr:FtsH protease activity modulator HflK [Deltaproteobacteria bacterium]
MEDDNRPFSVPPPGFEDAKEVYQKHGGWLKIIIPIIIVGYIVISSYYKVNPDEVGVLTRFGAYIETTEPGPHFMIPFVEDVQRVQAKRQHKQEFGFRTETTGIKSAFRRDRGTLQESMMLTGDLNVAIVEWIVHYKISDSYQFLFKVRAAKDTLHDLSQATLRAVVGDYSVTEVLTRGREEVLEKARIHLNDLCKRYETGITVQRIELKDSAPPDQVKPSFNEVNQAEQERDRLQNEAWSRYNQVIPNARGEAKQLIQEAQGYAVERENNARGDAKRFLAIQEEYARAPVVTRARLYLETMTQVLPKAGKKVFMDEKAKGVMPLLFPADSNAGPVAAPQVGGAR